MNWVREFLDEIVNSESIRLFPNHYHDRIASEDGFAHNEYEKYDMISAFERQAFSICSKQQKRN